MFTRKAVGYFAFAAVLLLLALFLEDWQLAILVLPLASLFFLTNAFGFPEKVELHLDQKVIPSETFGDEEIRVIGKVTNTSDTSLESVEVQETLPPELAPVRGMDHTYASIRPGETLDLAMEFKDPGADIMRSVPSRFVLETLSASISSSKSWSQRLLR